MKNLLKKLFYWDTPAEGAVFALLLSGLGGWCLTTAFCFTDGLFACTDNLKSWSWLSMIHSKHPWVWWLHLVLVLAGLFIALYRLIVTGHFYHTQIRNKWRSGIWWLAGAYCIGLFAVAYLAGKEATRFFEYFMWYWIIPLVCLPKQWRWVIPAAFAPVFFRLPFSALTGLLQSIAGAVSGENGFSLRLLSAAPWLIYVSVLLVILCGFCGFKAYANAAGKPIRAMFGKGAAAVLLLFLLTYGVSLGVAYSAHSRTERQFAELEKHFGHPVNAQGLKDLYYQGRKPDAAFWRKVLSFKLKFKTASMNPEHIFSPTELANLRKLLEGSRELCELENLFDTAELPAADRKFPRGNIVGMLLPELQMFRDFALCEAWRVRFAVSERNTHGVLTALKRMVKVRDFLVREPMLIGTLVMISCEDTRMDALERLLRSGLLTDSQLVEQQNQLTDFRKRMKTVHLHAVYGEAVMGMDICDLFTYGRASGQGESASPALYDYRWLFPAGWYLLTRSRSVLAEHYKVSELTSIVYKRQRVPATLLSDMMLPGLDAAGKRINRLTARYLAMETLIGIELEKRRTGQYPEKLENPPLDPFGQPLLYRHGKMPYIRHQWDSKMNMLGPGKKVMVDAVAVWSRGPNRKDDQGLSNRKENGNLTDDARAMMMKNPL